MTRKAPGRQHLKNARAVAVATTNLGKLREFQALLPDDVSVFSLLDFAKSAPEESGASFAENARIKSTALSREINLIVIADDSGLVVDVLGGAPGVYSARYAGLPANDERNIDLVLSQLSGQPFEVRTARFQCSVSVAFRGEELLTASATCEGRIGYERQGDHGFGYDPIFVLPSGRTMAELTAEEKNQISHRSRAFRTVADPLRALIDELDPAGDTSS